MKTRPAQRRSALATVAVFLSLLGLPTPATAASAPAAPSAVVASFGGAGLVVSWADNSSDESGFSIERCLGGSCTDFGQVATVGAGVTSFTDLYNTSTGSYRVRAYNSAGSSQYSGSAEIVLVSSGDAAARMTAAPISGRAPLTVAFDGSASTGLNGTPSSWQWSFGDNQTAAGVTAGHTYTAPGVYAASLKVTTSGGFGGATGTTAAIITVTAPALVAPSDLTATSPARGQIRLAWSNPVSSTTALTLERCKGAKCTSFTRLAVLTTTATSYLDTKAIPGTTYKYRLAASESTLTAYSNTAVATASR